MKKILFLTTALTLSTPAISDYKIFLNQKLDIPEPVVDNSCPSDPSPKIASLNPVLWYSSTNVNETNGQITQLNPIGNTNIAAISTTGRETLLEENSHDNCPAIVTDGDNMTANYNLGSENRTS